MGRMMLILVTGAAMLLTVATLNLTRTSTGSVHNSLSKYEKAQARNNSISAVEYAIKQIFQDTSWNGANSLNLINGASKIVIANTSKRYPNGPDGQIASGRLITAIGTYGNGNDTVRVIVRLPSSLDPSMPPPFLDYAIASGNDLHINGNVNITDDNNNSWNANVHTNGSFSMNGNNNINGFLTYVGTAQSNPAARLNTNIIPNNNPTGQTNRKNISPVTFPVFNAASFSSKATIIYNSNKSLSGNITLGTKNNPEVIFVNGDLQLSGTVSGYGYFIVKGNIIVNGNVTLNSPDSDLSSIGLYAQGDLNANGNVQLNAQIYTGGNVNLGGNVNVHGSVVTKGHVNFNGNVDIYYKPVNASLANPLWPDYVPKKITRPQTISYY